MATDREQLSKTVEDGANGIAGGHGERPPLGMLVWPPGHPGPKKGEPLAIALPSAPEELDITVLGRNIAGPSWTPCGFRSIEDPENDEAFHQQVGAYFHPEIERRERAGQDVSALKPIRTGLAIFDRSGGRRVLFNDEVHVVGSISRKYGKIRKGDPITVDQVHDAYDLKFQGRDVQTEGFIWISFRGTGYVIWWNLLPCQPTDLAIPAGVLGEQERMIQDAMAEQWFRGLVGNAFTEPEAVRGQMVRDGWIPSPAIIPETWRRMCERYSSGDRTGAAQLAVAAVDDVRLRQMVDNWRHHEPFRSDLPFLERAIQHYNRGDWISAVSVALPRLEGLMNRALVANRQQASRRIATAFGLLDQAARGPSGARWIGVQLTERLQEFVDTFLTAQFDPNDPTTAALTLGRHAHAHGGTEASRYDQAYALQVILAIDTLFFVLVK